ncbi:MAG: bifunctional riboflavin kinase/FAD synthetase [Anaerolineae bacterium]|nr:bifunctional riboflavin kinase/FAD synthetase [Anaerolineae bacterium]
MEHIYDLSEARLEKPSLVTIGVFDGVHRGHQMLIKQLVEDAHHRDRLAVVVTFYPHPDVVLKDVETRYYLTTPEQRAEQLLNLGVDLVVTQRFDDNFRQVRAGDYVNQLLHHLNMQVLWVGTDFAMGYQRQGNVQFLRMEGQAKDFDLHVIDLVTRSGEIISSTAIRNALHAGEVEQANYWLGRGYAVSGKVIQGQQRGRTIGFPTANIAVWEEQALPANGVYAGWASLGNERFMAVTNIGVRPTFAGDDITVEAYLLDFNREIYGQQLTLTFETRLRPEKKFENIQALVEQIGRDAQSGREYLTRATHS